MQTFVKCVGWIQDKVYGDPAYLYKTPQRDTYILNILMFHHVNWVQKRQISFYILLLLFGSLLMVPCGSKHLLILSATLRYTDIMNKSVHFVGLVSRININCSCKILSFHFLLHIRRRLPTDGTCICDYKLCSMDIIIGFIVLISTFYVLWRFSHFIYP